MIYVFCFLIGVVVGAFSLFMYIMDWYAKLKARESDAERKVADARQVIQKADDRHQDQNLREASMAQQQKQFNARVVAYEELQGENIILKRDLQNTDVLLHRFEIDGELRDEKQKVIEEQSNRLAKRYLAETVKAVITAIGPSNFASCKTKLLETIRRCREIGFMVSDQEETKLFADLREEFEKAVRAEFEREEQARIRSQIREEERLKREIERELSQLERERVAIQAALDQALAEARGQFSSEVERLKARLSEAEEKSKRAISMAQQTKAGHVYILSNIGAFGEGVFKVGMTRRLNPKERVYELGCAAVPFPFDIHVMISCDDAPSLENAIHRALHKRRINKANPRKEFFRTSVEELSAIVKSHHGEIEFIADPDAIEYRQSLTMSDEDIQFIESVYEAVEEDLPADD